MFPLCLLRPGDPYSIFYFIWLVFVRHLRLVLPPSLPFVDG